MTHLKLSHLLIDHLLCSCDLSLTSIAAAYVVLDFPLGFQMLSRKGIRLSGVLPHIQVLCRVAAVSLTEESLPLHWPERRLFYSANSSLKRLVKTPKPSENTFRKRADGRTEKLVLSIPFA